MERLEWCLGLLSVECLSYVLSGVVDARVGVCVCGWADGVVDALAVYEWGVNVECARGLVYVLRKRC